MISKNLQFLFLLSLFLITVHGIEETLTGFRHSDSFVVSLANYFNTTPETFYWVFHIIWWTLLPTAYVFLRKSTVILPLLTLFSVVFAFELHHVAKALIVNQYYPGMITAFFYPILGIFFYSELIRNWRQKITGSI